LRTSWVGAFFGRRDIRDRAAARNDASLILDRVGLNGKQDVQAASLSIPERRRMELARALATDPVLLLLDEVMAGLVPSEVDDLVGLVHEVCRSGVTIIVVEHVMRAIVALSDRVVVLQLGRVLLEGTPTEVLRDGRVVASYLGERGGLGAIGP
jgi:branched-chain amino acid transport system ATP-binding protein